MKSSKKYINFALTGIYLLFLIISFLIDFTPGEKIGFHFRDFFITMLKIIPFAFVLIGLFEVWVKRETVEKHLGEESNFLSYFWAIVLAGTTVGGIYISLPVSYSLYKKGARLSVIFTYIGASTITRIPMTIFEASFLGVKFTVVRFLTSLPLLIISSLLLEKYLKKRGFKLSDSALESEKT